MIVIKKGERIPEYYEITYAFIKVTDVNTSAHDLVYIAHLWPISRFMRLIRQIETYFFNTPMNKSIITIRSLP